MTDCSKRLLAWFVVMWLCFGSCLAFQYFTGYPIKLLQRQEAPK